jgi:glycerol uptake facilitator protein
MDDVSYSQKLLAEVLGTAMLVFVGVGSVPATLIVGGNAPFTTAELGMISFAFAMIVVALIYAIGHKAVTVGLGIAAYGGGRCRAGVLRRGRGYLHPRLRGLRRDRQARLRRLRRPGLGMAVFAAIIPVAPATGASINPARTIGPMLVLQFAGGTVHWGQLPVYLLAEFVGAAAAGLLYGVIATVRTGVRVTAQPAASSTVASEGAMS